MHTLQVWLWSLGSVLIVSLISLIGLLTLTLSTRLVQRVLFFMVAFAAGAMIGDAVIHLLPEAVSEHGFTMTVSLSFIAGVLIFFILEKFIHWRHCHIPTSDSHPHPFAYMNLFGDALHNFIDGMVVAGSFVVSIPLGIATTIAVVFHEIPQEIGDFGVLLHGGFTKNKALLFNFIVGLTALFGAVVSLVLADRIANYMLFVLPFTAGGFIYIAGSDLIPELNKECEPSKNVLQFLGMVLGIVTMIALLLLD
jgi:zinc and cadmium transporter